MRGQGLVFLLVSALMLSIAACREEGPAEKAGRQLDETMEKLRDAGDGPLERLGESIDETLDDAQKALDDVIEDARKAAKEARESARR